MRKPDFCILENKAQISCAVIYLAADQHLCSRYLDIVDSKILRDLYFVNF